MRARRILVATGLAIASAGLAGTAWAQASAPSATPSAAGLWKTIDDDTKAEKSLVRITETGGVLSGRVDKLLDPNTPKDRTCTACTDERKGQPVLGMVILRGVKREADDPTRYDGGEILDPNNGKTYRVRMRLVDNGSKLDVRGYIGTPLLGRTQTWIRVE